MEKNHSNRFPYILFVLILLTLNITKVISFTDSIKFNMALSDVFIPFFLILSLFFWRKYGFKHVFRYAIFWIGLIGWIILVALIAMKNELIINAGWIGQLEELAKTGLCILYFFVGYNTLKVINLKTFSFTWSLSTIIFVIGGFVIYILSIKGVYFWSNDPRYLRFFMGTDTDPNHAATYLTLSFFGIGISAMLSKRFRMKIYFYTVMILSIVGLIFTGSRGGIIGFVIGIILLICYYAYKNWRVALLLFLVLILMTIIFLVIDQLFLDSVFTQRLLYKLVNIESGIDVRASLSKTAWMMGADHPIFGVGRGNYILNSAYYFDQIGSPYIDDIPHNTYVGLVAETGIIGLILFCMPLILIMYTLYRKYVNNRSLLREEMPILIWFGSGLFALGVQALVLNVENRRFLWYIAGIIIYIFENDSFFIKNKLSSFKFKNLNSGLIGITLIVFISSYFVVQYAHAPYQLQVVNQNFIYEIPHDSFIVGATYSIGIKLYISQNEEKTNRVYLKIIEKSNDGKKIVLDSYSYYGAIGIAVRSFTPTMDDSKIYLEVHKLDQSLGNFAILPLYLYESNYIIDLTQWYFMQPELIMRKTSIKNKLDYDDWVHKTDLSIGATFENLLSIKSIKVNQNDEFNTEVSVEVKVLEDINLNLIPFLHGFPDNLHILDKSRIASGGEVYSLVGSIDTKEWKVGQSNTIIFSIPRQAGIYSLKMGFYHIESDKVVYLNVDGKSNSKTHLLDLGWLNLDSFTEGIIYE